MLPYDSRNTPEQISPAAFIDFPLFKYSEYRCGKKNHDKKIHDLSV